MESPHTARPPFGIYLLCTSLIMCVTDKLVSFRRERAFPAFEDTSGRELGHHVVHFSARSTFHADPSTHWAFPRFRRSRPFLTAAATTASPAATAASAATSHFSVQNVRVKSQCRRRPGSGCGTWCGLIRSTRDTPDLNLRSRGLGIGTFNLNFKYSAHYLIR